MKISLLINMKMPTIVGIFIFISRENFMISWFEHEKSFIISGPDQGLLCPLTDSLVTTEFSMVNKCPDETFRMHGMNLNLHLRMLEDSFSSNMAHMLANKSAHRCTYVNRNKMRMLLILFASKSVCTVSLFAYAHTDVVYCKPFAYRCHTDFVSVLCLWF